MAEVLVTVAILAILLAVAVPNVIAARKNLEMTELDATARIIFVAAQDNLTGMRGSGMLGELAAAGQADPAEAKVLYLTDESALMTKLLPFGAVDPTVAANHYLIKFNVEYGTVLEVYYAEETLPDAAALFAMAGSGDAARRDRRDASVGYYAGGGVTVDTPERLPAPTVTVDNGAALTVTVTVPDAAETLRHAGLYLSLRPADGSAPAISAPLTLSGLVSGTATVTLDSLESGKQFKDLYPGLTPGCELLVSAVLTPLPPGGAGDKVYLGAASAEAAVNSLFAGRETRGGADTALIANGRHLQNLRTGFSGVDGAVTAAVQTAAIAWNGAYPFYPIENGALAAYDGANLSITGLIITGTDHAGLFGALSAVGGGRITLRNITLVNTRVGGGTESRGMLVGSAARVTVENCGVYVSVLKDMGGGSYTYDYAQYAGYGMDSSAKHTGGLIGSAQDCTVTDSFAALPSISVVSTLSGYALGGLIGSASDCKVERSYASAGQLAGDAGYNGMFIGWADAGTTVNHSYAVGNIRALGQPGTMLSGFLCGGAAVTDSYCAVTYLDYFGSNRAVERYGFTSGGTADRCAFLDTGSETKKGDGAASLSYDALKAWGGLRSGWRRPDAKSSYPYDEELAGRAYPFATPLRNGTAAAHRGSWPLSAVDLALAYYEVYADGTWGFYAPATRTFHAVNTLQSNMAEPGVTVVADGYALLSPTRLSTPPGITYPVTAERRASAACVLSAEPPVELDGKTYHVYLLPAAALQTGYADGAAVWQKLYCGGEAYWYEPHFAAAVAVYEEGETPAAPQALQVRTPRQLYNLGLVPALWDRIFVQQLDIDCADYQWAAYGLGDTAPVLTPIGSAGAPFTGGYNGGGSAIRGVTLGASGTFCGLFGSVGTEGVILSVALWPEGITVPAEAGALIGPLAGENNGKITASSVTLPTSLATGGARFGGLVGYNGGSIARSAVYSGAAGSAVDGSNTLAGFAVETSGTVTECSVRPGGTLGYGGLTLTSRFKAAGFAGMVGGTVEQSWCAATVTATGAGSEAAGFALSVAPGAAVSGCYANCETGAKGRAAGFALDLSGSADHCYALLRVSSSGGAASGFADTVAGHVRASYAAAQAEGTTSCGFARSAGSGALAGCYYLSGGYTGAQTGTAVGYGKLTAALCFKTDAAWTDANQGKSHPFDTALGDDYPFPRLTALDHVGDWPEETADAVGLVYYEKYNDGSYGYYGLDEAEAQANALKGNEYKIVETGYGFLLPEGTAAPRVSRNNDTPLSIADTYLSAVPAIGGKLLHPFSPKAVTALNSGYNWVTLQTVTVLPNDNYRFENYRCVNFSFAAAITAAGKSGTMGTPEVPLQVRTQDQFSHVGIDTTLLYIRQTHDIDIAGEWVPVNGKDGGTRIIDGYGNKITGLSRPLFASIQQNSTLTNLWITGARVIATDGSASGILINSASSGITVTDCRVTDSSIQGQKVAGMFGSVEFVPRKIANCAVENVTVISDVAGGVAAGFAVSVSGNGEFSNCHVSPSLPGGRYDKVLIQALQDNSLAAGFIGTVAATPIASSYAVATVTAPYGQAAGFVGALQQSGRLSASYSNCITAGEDAAGFVLNPAGGTVANCYALLSVKGTNAAYGFCGNAGDANISACYSAATVAGSGTVYGFSPWSGRISGCYYLFGENGGGGSKATYAGLADLTGTLGGAWTAPTAARTHAYTMPAGSVYPFPMLTAAEHYGDWPPTGSSDKVIGVFRYVYDKAGGTIVITAGSLTCTVENGNNCNVEMNDPQFLKSARFPIDPARAAALQTEGYGVFWSYGFSDFVKNGKKEFFYDAVYRWEVGDTGGDLAISDGFYFVPMETTAPPALSFRHDNENSPNNWTAIFEYDTANDRFQISN